VNASGAMRDGHGHGFVIFALMDAEVGAGTKLQTFHELEKLWILLENTQHFVRAGYLSIG
jgi:hypothetical protein